MWLLLPHNLNQAAQSKKTVTDERGVLSIDSQLILSFDGFMMHMPPFISSVFGLCCIQYIKRHTVCLLYVFMMYFIAQLSYEFFWICLFTHFPNGIPV